MFFVKVKKYTILAYRAIGFFKENGARWTILRIIFKIKRDKKYSYKTLRRTFSRKFIKASQLSNKDQSWTSVIDFSAQSPLERVLKNLNIKEDPTDVLASLKGAFDENNYCRFLENLFTIENVIENIRGEQEYTLIQASALPQISEKPPRRRILFITAQIPNPYHGGGNRIINFMKILSEDNDIYLATIYYPNEDDDLLTHLGRYCHSLYKIPYWQFGDNRAEILKWLEGKSMDIVHYEWPASLKNYEPDFGHLHIFTYMEAVSLRLLMDMEKFPPLSTAWLETLNQLIHALKIEIADTTTLTSRIAVTTKDGDFFRGIYPYQEYAVLNHGVNLDEFILPDVDSEINTLLFVGNFGHYPNVDAMTYFFNEIWDDIRREVPDVRIYLVGPNPPKEFLHLTNNENIIITGRVPDVRPYIQKATVCIAPLITGAGLRGKVIEYAALKRTFVATSIAMTDLAYEDGSDYLKADTASSFSQRVISMLEDDKLRQKMANSAYKTTQKNYDTRRLVNFLYGLYDHLIMEQH
jgi:glycosyltransferase involved in cell wall biosynthesis